MVDAGIPGHRQICEAIHWNVYSIHWVGLRENLQDNPIYNGKKPWFPVDFPLNQSNEVCDLQT